MAQKFSNAARTTLASGIASGDTTLTIASNGSLFPVADTGTGSTGGTTDWFKAVIQDGTNLEVVYVRTHTSGSTTFSNVQRGQEGTTAAAFAAGAVVGLRVTAADMADLAKQTDTIYAITDGASVGLDPENGQIQTWTLGASRTPTATNFANGQSMTLMVDDGTSYSITWTTIGVTWIGGTAPALATSGYTAIVLWKVGGTVYGMWKA